MSSHPRVILALVLGLGSQACLFYRPTGSAEGSTSSGDDSTDATTDVTTGPDAASTSTDTTDDVSTTSVPVCGDGVIDGDEECDAGEGNNDEGVCTSACKLARCGDGLVGAGEDCDDGNDDEDDACSSACVPTCGDGVLRGDEQCDEGPLNADGAACTASCRLNVCGDGLVHGGVEACDDGNTDDLDACVQCKQASCGDGYVHAGEETCDDGPDNGLYGKCGADCTAPGPYCGDGFVNGPEQCDDGNAKDDDPCSNTCIQARYVFVTGDEFLGDFGGLPVADSVCQTQASQLFGGAWKAWLADSVQAPASRLDKAFDGWYLALDDQPLAHGWAGLTSGTLLGSLDFDIDGSPVEGSFVWTGSGADGSGSGIHCNEWTTPMGSSGTFGVAGALDSSWSAAGQSMCQSTGRLYCIQQ